MSGLTQMLKAFGIDIDPNAIQIQINEIRDLALSIDTRLKAIQDQGAANAATLERIEHGDTDTKENGLRNEAEGKRRVLSVDDR